MFGEVVRAHRARLGITQEELAERSGLSVRGVRAIETNDVAMPRVHTVRRLASAFQLDGAAQERFCRHACAPIELEPRPDVPAQLPPDVAAFTGRGRELARLGTMLDVPAGSTALPIILISGTGGVGKTALAVHWAHRIRPHFPDGQLYVNLRGYHPDEPVGPRQALAGFLTALGVPAQQIPLELDECAARYRTAVAGKRVLVVLDNAATVDQVRPLLPGSASCAALVTSRDRLAGLVATDGARRLNLDLLPAAEGIALLCRLVGPRAAADPAATASLTRLCARLPLALRVAAELAVSRPATPLAELAAELTDRQRRLNLLDAGGDPRAAVTTVFSWSLRNLPPAAARTFRLLGLHPGRDFDGYAAAALTATGIDEAGAALDTLTRASLLHRTETGRYGMHDLLRIYAINRNTAEDDREAAVERLFTFSLAAAVAAMRLADPSGIHYQPEVTAYSGPLPPLADAEDARAWLDRERTTLVSVARHAAALGRIEHAVAFSRALYRYLDNDHFVEGIELHKAACDSARAGGDLSGTAYSLFALGGSASRIGSYQVSAVRLNESAALFRRLGDRLGEARARNSLGIARRNIGAYAEAAADHHCALTIFGELGDTMGQAHALTSLGAIDRLLGRYDVAAQRHREALDLYRSVHDREGEARALNNLGLAETMLGDHAAAVDHLRRSLSLHRRASNMWGEAATRESLGRALLHQNRPDLAAHQFRRAAALFVANGERGYDAWALLGLGESYLARNNPRTAATHYAEALVIAEETEARPLQAEVLEALGRAHEAMGDRIMARAHLTRAVALYTSLDAPQTRSAEAALLALDSPE